MKLRVTRTLKDDDMTKAILFTEAEARTGQLTEHVYDCYKKLSGTADHGYYVAEITGPRSITGKLVEMGLFSSRLNHPMSKRTRVLVGTAAAANHGIDYYNCMLVCREGFPPDIYSFFQELGRLARNLRNLSNGNGERPVYRVVADLSSYYYLLTRAFGQNTKEGKQLALKLLHEVMSIFLSSQCVHFMLASKFGDPDAPDKRPPTSCEGNCYVCNGSYQQDILIPYDKSQLRTSLFSILCGSTGPIKLHPDLTEHLWNDKKRRDAVFKNRTVSKYQVEALVWHLAVFGVLRLEYKDDKGEVYVKVDMDVFDENSNAWDKFENHRNQS